MSDVRAPDAYCQGDFWDQKLSSFQLLDRSFWGDQVVYEASFEKCSSTILAHIEAQQ